MKQMQSSKLPISAAIITKNEEEKLPDCLESLACIEDIVVVDSGSSDRTVEIAETFGARVFEKPWRGFSGQKQFAVDQAKYDWVLILDADERIPAETAQFLAGIIRKSQPNICGYTLRRKNFFHGRWIKHCGWWPNRILRFVDKTKGSFDGKPVHESWQTDGPVEALDFDIHHLSFSNYSELITKLEQYTTISARELYAQKEQKNSLIPIVRGVWMFLTVYFFKQGFRDGFDGLVIALMHGAGSFFKHAKHLELSVHAKSNNVEER